MNNCNVLAYKTHAMANRYVYRCIFISRKTKNGKLISRMSYALLLITVFGGSHWRIHVCKHMYYFIHFNRQGKYIPRGFLLSFIETWNDTYLLSRIAREGATWTDRSDRGQGAERVSTRGTRDPIRGLARSVAPPLFRRGARVAAAGGGAANRLSRMIAARGGLRDRPPARREAVSVRAAEKQRDRHLVDKI